MDPSKHSSSAYKVDQEKWDENYERLFPSRVLEEENEEKGQD